MKEKTEVALFWWVTIIALVLFWSGVFYLLWPALAGAQPRQWDVVLAWDANTEADLAGYRLYENGAQVGNDIPAGTETVTRVLSAGTYTWHLTAFDDSLNESGPSNSVGLTLDEQAPAGPININITLSIHVGP